MNKSQPYKSKKFRAQAIMEFTLAIPTLLLLLYGVMETGRLLFIYASTITAARQAVRYGSATGIAQDGITHFYQDCAGITATAKNVGFINKFESVSISYDGGFSSNGVINHMGDSTPTSNLDASPDVTPNDPDCGEYIRPKNGDRIVVEVTAQWQPIVPIVPLKAFTIKSQSERTILAAISVSVTAVSQGWQNNDNNANGGILALSILPSPTTYSTAGQTITYAYILSNTGLGNLSAPFTVNDNSALTSCSSAPATLAPGDSFTCIGTYSITQANLDAGSVTNQATASANGSPSNTGTKTITAIQSPALALSKSAYPTAAYVTGTNITYTYTITNTANVSLTSPYTVADNKIPSGANCSGAVSPLAPGASTTCTATYNITAGDISSGSVVNEAKATATFKSSTITSNNATATVSTAPLIFTVSASPSTAILSNQVITYTYKITNNTDHDARSLNVIDDKAVSNNCPTTISKQNTINCTGTYTIAQADYELGNPIKSTAYTTATINGQTLTSNTASTSVSLTRDPRLSIALVSVTPSQPAGYMIAGTTTVTYIYSLKNEGNVSLASPFTVDNGAVTACGTIANIAPFASANCTVTYPVSQADKDAGSFIKTATASGMFGGTKISSTNISTQVITYSGSRFSITISANPAMLPGINGWILFTYTITNTGGTPLAHPSLTSNLTAIDCPSINQTLDLLGKKDCTSNYQVTSSLSITNTVTATSATAPTVTTSLMVGVCNMPNLTLNVSTENFKPPIKFEKWIITNNTGAPIHITAFDFKWNAIFNGGTDLNSASLSQLWSWSGTDTDGYFNSTSFPNGSFTINNGSAIDLTAIFSKQSMQISDLHIKFSEAECYLP